MPPLDARKGSMTRRHEYLLISILAFLLAIAIGFSIIRGLS